MLTHRRAWVFFQGCVTLDFAYLPITQASMAIGGPLSQVAASRHIISPPANAISPPDNAISPPANASLSRSQEAANELRACVGTERPPPGVLCVSMDPRSKPQVKWTHDLP